MRTILIPVVFIMICAFVITHRNHTLPPAFDRSLIEADWLMQAASWRTGTSTETAWDALGAVDGIKNGKYGFHTGETTHPWWQVDLEKVTPIARILVYNRLDYAPGLHNTDNMQVLVFDDGEQWKQIHDCAGKHFGGMNALGPLNLSFEKAKIAARFVRLQIPSNRKIYFHLDEVDVRLQPAFVRETLHATDVSRHLSEPYTMGFPTERRYLHLGKSVLDRR